jgi:L-rhamnose mutarotase
VTTQRTLAARKTYLPVSCAMIRKAFVMQVHPGQMEEYVRRHNPIWPELATVLKAHGVHNYSIHLHEETLQLFAYAEIESEELWQAISSTPECRRWWAHMSTLMAVKEDQSPRSVELREVFHLE